MRKISPAFSEFGFANHRSNRSSASQKLPADDVFALILEVTTESNDFNGEHVTFILDQKLTHKDIKFDAIIDSRKYSKPTVAENLTNS